jgi:hypothetical protein
MHKTLTQELLHCPNNTMLEFSSVKKLNKSFRKIGLPIATIFSNSIKILNVEQKEMSVTV